MACPLCDGLARIRSGDHHAHIAELSESFLTLAETQGCPGWCVLVLKDHQEHLEALEPTRRARLLEDLNTAALAIRAAFPEVTRLNYACLCNLVPHLHWHLMPRRAGDPAGAVWSWSEDRQRGNAGEAERRGMIERIRRELTSGER